MSQTYITVAGDTEGLTAKDRKVKELRERLGKGGIKAFDHVVLFSENPSAVEDNWTVVRLDEIESLPVHLSVKGRLKKMTRLTSHDLRFVKASGETFSAEVYIFARVESGIGSETAELVLADGPVKYFNKKLEEGSTIKEAYVKTVEEYLDPHPIHMGYATRSSMRYELSEMPTTKGFPMLSHVSVAESSSDDLMNYSVGNNGNGLTPSSTFTGSPPPALFDVLGDITNVAKSPRKQATPAKIPQNSREEQQGQDPPAEGGPPPGEGGGGAGGPGDAGGAAGGGNGGDDEDDEDEEARKAARKGKGQGKKSKRPDDDEEEEPEEQVNEGVEEGQEDAAAEKNPIEVTTDLRRSPRKRPRGVVSSTEPTNSKARKVAGPGSTKTVPAKVAPGAGKAAGGKAAAGKTAGGKAAGGKSPTGGKISSTAKRLHRELFEDISDEEGDDDAEQARLMAVLTQSEKDKAEAGPSTSKDTPPPKKSRKSAKTFVSDAAFEALAEEIRGKQCCDDCRCAKLSVADIRDACKDRNAHLIMYLLTRLHNSSMDGQRNGRKETTDLRHQLNRIEEKLDQIMEYSMSAAQRVTATEYVSQDAEFLGLPWKSMEAVQDALDDSEKKAAVTRLLQSPLVVNSLASYVSDVTKYFFAPELVGKLYNGIPRGYRQGKRIIKWGIEYFAVPKAFGIMMTNAMTKMYRHPKQQGARKIYNNWNDGRMTSTAAAKDDVILRKEAKEHPMFMMIYQNEVAKLNVLSVPAPLDGDNKDMTRYTKAFADKVATGYKAWESEVILRGSTPEEEAGKFLAGLKPRGKKDEAPKAVSRPKKATGKKATPEEDSETAEDSDNMSLREEEEPEDMDTLAQEDE